MSFLSLLAQEEEAWKEKLSVLSSSSPLRPRARADLRDEVTDEGLRVLASAGWGESLSSLVLTCECVLSIALCPRNGGACGTHILLSLFRYVHEFQVCRE